ncbi:glucosamine-6-phosphate deaminase [Acetivibrio sp. MSJd-27]|jgi:glucosamine-6-phosphate deaminase|uniref:glucosamine-6-phosphate deaminase n=1 Tax=Acetivibrio sp. MSJd-27 TaxID=2841523 RepID=UPI0015AD3B5A|nr:glucosamine-6-phosphate deaminase [Acetivibrio sp. MSJd-27]MBU5449477.1 glucosamine-6-phosphate deaminase [Acetivibrio sp. MSJd-27]
MKIIRCKDYDEMSAIAGKIMVDQVKEKPDSILGLATGSTPIGMYKKMIEAYKNGEVSFKNVHTFNLDEYYKIEKTNDQSYYYFMNENLFSHIDIDKNNIDIPNGQADDYQAECERYEKAMEESAGIDIQVLGVGVNGHIGFNEPEELLYEKTHLTGLTQSTIEANSRFFDSIDLVPTSALTMGMGSIMKAKKILVLISGKSKHDVVTKILGDRMSTQTPVTLLKGHHDVTVIVDDEAYNG